MHTFKGMTQERLRYLVGRFQDMRIGVLGDYFLDKYLDVDPAIEETSVETGLVAHQVVVQRHSPGAAGTVVCNLAALGTGAIHAIGYTGDDGESYDLRNDLATLGCRLEALHLAADRMTPTYLKPRNREDTRLAGEHSRYDTKNRNPTPEPLQREIIASVDQLLPQLHALIVLDQVEEAECGVVTTPVREAIAKRAARNLPCIFWADSRCRICDFRHVTLKANQFELVGRVNPMPGDVVGMDQLGEGLAAMRATTGAPVFVTRGPDGMLVSDPEPTLVPGIQVEGPIDETGAGDSATAGAVLALAAGATLPEAALIGNLVASITIQQLATTGTARPRQLFPRLQLWHQQHDHGSNELREDTP